MKNFAFVLIAAFLASCSTRPTSSIKKNEAIHVVFYNVENLFDIYDDPQTADEEFTPNSSKRWTVDRYEKKLDHLSNVLVASEHAIPNIIGLAEIENIKVVEDLIANENFQSTSYDIVHTESVDTRGIDNGLLYDKEVYSLVSSEFIQPVMPNGKEIPTRKIVYAHLEHPEGHLHLYVNHWPSRGGDFEIKRSQRLATAAILKKHIESIQKKDPKAHIIVMGDFNDYPHNKSISEVLGASKNGEGDLVNMMWSFEDDEQGTYCYKKDWGCLDQFIVSKNFLENNDAFQLNDGSVEIIKKDWLMYTAGDGKMYPNKTYSRDKYYGGYSDHLAISLFAE